MHAESDIIVCQPTASSSSDSNFESALSPLTEPSLKQLSVTHNEPIYVNGAKFSQLSVEKFPGISIISGAELSISELFQIEILGTDDDDDDEISDSEDDEMALNMKNKVTPITGTGSRNTPRSTPRSGPIFNVSRVKKVELGEMRRATEVQSSSRTPESGSVLRKVASITANATSTPITKKSNFVPEKLNFAAFEKFEGKHHFKK